MKEESSRHTSSETQLEVLLEVAADSYIAYARLDNVKSSLSRTRSRIGLGVETGVIEASDEHLTANNDHTAPKGLQVSSQSTKTSNKHSYDPLLPMLQPQSDLSQAM